MWWRLRRYKPEDNVAGYLTSRNTSHLNKKVWPPLEEPFSNKQRQRRELINTQEQLDLKRKFYIDQKKILNKQWETIGQEGLSLQENFVHFNEFMCVNLEKRKRARVNIRESKKFRLNIEEQVEQLKINIVQMKEVKAELDQKIRDHKIYEQYLSAVVGMCSKEDGLINENELVARYEYYSQLSMDFAHKQENIFSKLQAAKSEMLKFVEKSEHTVLGLRTQAAALQGSFEEVSRNVRHLESLITRIQDGIRQRSSDIDLVKSATWNLYFLICRRQQVEPKYHKEDVENQLIYIKQTLTLIHRVNEELTNQINAKKKAQTKCKTTG